MLVMSFPTIKLRQIMRQQNLLVDHLYTGYDGLATGSVWEAYYRDSAEQRDYLVARVARPYVTHFEFTLSPPFVRVSLQEPSVEVFETPYSDVIANQCRQHTDQVELKPETPSRTNRQDHKYYIDWNTEPAVHA